MTASPPEVIRAEGHRKHRAPYDHRAQQQDYRAATDLFVRRHRPRHRGEAEPCVACPFIACTDCQYQPKETPA